MNKRFSKEQLAHEQIHKWFDKALGRDAPRPSREDSYALADQLKVLVHRADNNEKRKLGPVPRRHLKDLSPKQELQKKIDALVHAARELEEYGWTRISNVKGDVALEELRGNLRIIGALYADPIPAPRPGRPASPWKDMARQFAMAVQKILVKIRYRGGKSLSNRESATVIIATEAIKWAYRIKLKPSGFVSAMRTRNRSKLKRKSLSKLSRIRTVQR